MFNSAILLLSTVLLFTRLGHYPLRDDEALVGLVPPDMIKAFGPGLEVAGAAMESLGVQARYEMSTWRTCSGRICRPELVLQRNDE